MFVKAIATLAVAGGAAVFAATAASAAPVVLETAPAIHVGKAQFSDYCTITNATDQVLTVTSARVQNTLGG